MTNGPLRVGIGGPVGVGKTTLTEQLCRALAGRCSMAVVTNVGPCHLEKLGSLEGVAKAKAEIVAGMERDEIASVIGVSVPTVDRDLRFARAWLNRALG